MPTETVEINVEVWGATPDALFVFNGTISCWVNRSQISDYEGEEDSPTVIYIPEWLAELEELV